MTTLREAAQQALDALEGVITDLRAAKAESERDWSLLEATQESLREHMAEVQRLRAALAQPATIAEWWAAKQAASGAQADLIAGALYDLMGDLTSRDETIRLGATEWATPAADALVAFAAKRGLSLDNPAIADWSKRIAAAPQLAPARVPLTDDQILNIIDDVLEGGSLVDVARAIEATHGITPTKEA